MIERTQRQAARFVTSGNYSRYASVTQMLTDLNWPTLARCIIIIIIIYLICQKRQGDTKRQSLYEGVSLEDTKPKTEGTNTEKTQLQKNKKEHIHI